MFKKIRFAGVTALALLVTATAFADLSKGIRGKVLDREGKPAKGVKVTIVDKSVKSLIKETTTDEKGNYIYGGLPTNQDGYSVTVKVGDLPEVTKETDVRGDPIKVKIFDQIIVDFDLSKDLKFEAKEVKASAVAQAKDLYGLEDYEGALKKADEAILQNDNVKAAAFLKAACLLKLNRLDEARDAFEAYNIKYPGNVDILGHLAELYEKKGDKAKAAEYRAQFKAKGGQVIGDTYNQGVAAFNAGDTSKAIEAFEAAIKEDAKDADAHRELAKCYAQTGKYSKAVEELKTYLKMRPDAEDKAMWEQAIPGLQKLKDTK